MCGAMLGDALSYGVGLHYKRRIHNLWFFRKHPKWLEKGEVFFSKHGGKSIFIGRFLGPARSMIPLIAGTFDMKVGRFFLSAIPSACLWAIGYILPGVFIGMLSLELSTKIAFEFILTVLIIIATVVFLSWLVHFFSKRLAKKVSQITRKIWKYLQKHKESHWLIVLLTDPYHPKNHRQLILFTYLLVTTTLFIIFTVSVLTYGFLTGFNEPINHLLISLRVNSVYCVMLFITSLGSVSTIFTIAFLVFLWLCFKRYWKIAICWIATIMITGGIVFILKSLFFMHRPYLMNGPSNSCFPSGHTAFVTSLISLSSILIAQELKRGKRYIPYVFATVIIVAIGFSRLYLGAHWLTDVISGFLLGISVALFITILHRRGGIQKIALKPFMIVVISVFGSVWILFGIYNFKKLKHEYKIVWPVYTTTFLKWQEHKTEGIPLYRCNRFGYPIEVFNVEWLSNLGEIKNDLKKQGWISFGSNLSIKNILKRLSTKETKHPLPLLPQTYRNEYPVLLMIKEGKNKKRIMVLRLWQSYVKIKDVSTPLWIGIMNYVPSVSHKWLIIKTSVNHGLEAVNKLIPFIKNNFKYQEIIYKNKKEYKVLQELGWKGKLLLIYK